MPAMKAGTLRQMIAKGEFPDWIMRERRIAAHRRRGMPTAKTIGRRLKTISMQLNERT